MAVFALDVVDKISSFDCLKGILEPITFSFSIYENGVPGSGTTKSRKIHKLKLGHLQSAVENLIKQLSATEELAINSRIKINDKNFHLPIIDLNVEDLNQFSDAAFLSLKEDFPGKIYVYKSGRSFHAYQDALLSTVKWKKFLGSLLLLNPPNGIQSFVDSRWIGHSLKQNFSALRLSCNTTAYTAIPKLETII